MQTLWVKVLTIASKQYGFESRWKILLSPYPYKHLGGYYGKSFPWYFPWY